jgi:8-oxo-dGTP pyrophosphatase MutT (NUDIX family)
MARSIPTWSFALVVVRLGHRFLMVHERKHGQGWYLPAGGVEAGESFVEAARRETREEAGVAITLDGILRIEHRPIPDGARCRVLFVAHPSDDTPPKQEADHDSLGAGWFTLDEIRALPLRGDEVLQLLEEVAAGAPVYPLSLLQPEWR